MSPVIWRVLQAHLLLFTLFLSTSFAEEYLEPRCGTTEQMEVVYERNLSSIREAEEFNQFTRSFIRNRDVRKEYVIPTVFHIFGTDFSGKTVDDALVIDALEKTNRDFQGLNSDWLIVNPDFEAVKEAINITFKLAQKDPNGNPTTGIIYHPEESGFGNGSGFDAKIQQYAWDNYKYMNVYIMLDLYADNDFYNSGVSWYPDTWMSDNNLARTVYNGKYLGTNTDDNFRRILTHEFGHWLNLKHTFEGGCSNPNDECDDTPQTTSNSGSCNLDEEKCTGEGVPNGENFMDYTECYRMFTKDQVTRMVAALESHPARKTLWQRENLILTGLLDESIEGVIANFSSNPTKLSSGESVTFTNGTQTEDGTTVTSLQWFFEGGTPSTFTGEEPPAIVYDEEGTFDVTLIATNSDGMKDTLFKEEHITVKNEYADPVINFGTYSHIGNVTFASINNSTEENGIVDYTDQFTAEVDKGGTYELSVQANVGNSGSIDDIRVRAWFDWNKNWKFDSDESVLNEEFKASEGDKVFTTEVTIPNTAVVDKTAFRVIVCYKMGTSGDNADDILDSGECEDYGVSISGLMPIEKSIYSMSAFAVMNTNMGIQFTKPLPSGTSFTLFDSHGRVVYTEIVKTDKVHIPIKQSTKVLFWKAENNSFKRKIETGKVLVK